MKHLYLLFFIFCNIALYGQIDDYLSEYRSSEKSNYKKEQQLLADTPQLLELVRPFLQDSLLHIRQKSYSFIFRKGMLVPISEQAPYIIELLKGCKDSNGSIVGQNLIWLQSFNNTEFSEEANELIVNLLRNWRLPHRKRLIMLAGYVDAGREWMKRQLLQSDVDPNERWHLNLALARMSEDASVDFCVNTLQSLELSNRLVEFVLPDIIYTRQKALLDICVSYVHSDELACFSADPDNESAQLCGYRILELLTPVILNFPLKESAIGGLETDDYQHALIIARKWFLDNPEYLIDNNRF